MKPNYQFPRPQGPPATGAMNRVGGGGAPPQAYANNNAGELLKLLPMLDDSERMQTREQLMESLAKDIFSRDANFISSIQQMHQSSGNQAQTFNAVDLVCELEDLVVTKYPDTSSQNYKGLAKKVIQTLKTRAENRQSLIGIMFNTDQPRDVSIGQVNEFFQTNVLFGNKPKPAGSGPDNSSGGSTNSNPFAFQKPASGGPPQIAGGPPRKPPGVGPQARLPQQRFATFNFFEQAAQTPAININQTETGSSQIPKTDNAFDQLTQNIFNEFQKHGVAGQNNYQEQERAPIDLQQQPPIINSNQQLEESPLLQMNFNFSDSGAAGSIQVPNNPTAAPIISEMFNGAAASGGGDLLGFFSNVEENNQIKSNQQFSGHLLEKSSFTLNPPPQDSKGRSQSNNPYGIFDNDNEDDQQSNPIMSAVSERGNFEMIPSKLVKDERKVEELERPIPVITQTINNQFEVNTSKNDVGNRVNELQKWPDVTIRNDEDMDTNQTLIAKQLLHGINKEEGSGPIQFEQKGEERESPDRQNQINLASEIQIPQITSTSLSRLSNNNEQSSQQSRVDHVYRHTPTTEEKKPSSKLTTGGIPPKAPQRDLDLDSQYETQSAFAYGDQMMLRLTQNVNNEDLIPYHHTPSQTQLTNQMIFKSPSMRGLIHQSSKPPQSVASINITNLEDSEGLIRAYKKKKGELDDLKQRYYQIETDYFTSQQRNKLLEEDVSKIRLSLNKAEKLLKEAQMKESRKDSDILQKQLTLKNQESLAYQQELTHQKTENAKLREKIKELMSRARANSSSSAFSSQNGSEISQITEQQLRQAQREKDDLSRTLDQLKNQFTNQLQYSQDQAQRNDLEKSQIIQRLQDQVAQLKIQAQASEKHYQEMIVSEKRRVEEEWREKVDEVERRAQQQVEKARAEALATVQQKTAEPGETEEDNSSYVHLQNKSSQGTISPGMKEEGGNYFVGYYEAPKSTNGSNQSQKQQIMQNSGSNTPQTVVHHKQQSQANGSGPNILNEYPVLSTIPNQEGEKLTTIQKEQQNPQRQQVQIPQTQQTLFNDDQDDFFSQFNQPVQKPLAQKQPQQASKPPLPQNNTYNFTMDEISFDQSFSEPFPTPPQQFKQQPSPQPKMPQAPPPMKQQAPVQNLVKTQQQQQLPQQPQLGKAQSFTQQVKPQMTVPQQQAFNYSSFFDNVTGQTNDGNKQNASGNVIPKSLFD